MANWYVTSTAGGGGAGSEGDPFTLAEAAAKGDYAIGDIIWMKAGTYTTSSAVNFTDTYVFLKGYNTTIGDLDEVWGEGIGATAKPVIAPNSSVASHVLIGGGNEWVENIVIDGTNGTNAWDGFSSGNFKNCVCKNLVGSPADGFSSLNKALFCLSYNNNGDGFSGGGSSHLYACSARSNGAMGIHSCASVVACGSYDNTSAGYAWCGIFIGCVSTGNGNDGYIEDAATDTFINCIAEDNSAWGYDISSVLAQVINCNAWNNTSGAVNNATPVNLDESDPAITDPANDDYSLGNSNLYGLGAYIGSLDGTGTLDLGAVQKSSGTGNIFRPLP